jgi:hypothetical protein
MSKHRRELGYAFIGIAVVSVVYLIAYKVTGTFPPPSSALGHWTGIIGLVFMLAAQTAYSSRKQTRDTRWGPMVKWLQAHVMMGLVGPYMVLIHTAGRFEGLVADVATLLTVIVLLSGVVGRYLYAAIPREMEGVDPEHLAAAKKALATWRAIHIPITWALFTSALVHAAGALYYATLLR